MTAKGEHTMAQNRRKVGIMGGTFDPIHVGHLVLAEDVRDAFGLDEVLFIPAAQPPHKGGVATASAEHRYIMTELATASNPHFIVSRMELDRKGPSYSWLTVTELQQQYGAHADFYFITGSDAINLLDEWHRGKDLLACCHFIVSVREGVPLDEARLARSFGALAKEHIHRLATPALEISSTDIRARIRRGASIRYLVPAAVADYITKEGLYLEHEL